MSLESVFLYTITGLLTGSLPDEEQGDAEFLFELLGQLVHFVVRRVVGYAGSRRNDGDGDVFRSGDVNILDDLLVRNVRCFGQGQEGGELADHRPVFCRDHVGVAVGPQGLAADAVVEAGDEADDELLALRQAVQGRVADHEGRMAGVIVEIDDFAYVVKLGRRREVQPFPLAVAVQVFQLVEEKACRMGDLLAVGFVDDAA